MRYPYFSVRLRTKEESYVLEENEKPFVISEDGTPKCLNSKESNEHLLAFAFKGNRIFIDVSHFIADGNGIAPVTQTLLYYYIEKRYPFSDSPSSQNHIIRIPVMILAGIFGAKPIWISGRTLPEVLG
ncbi:MAG TPA: hypothetical protein DCL38_01580 [Lachnospiraceae bacterium]|nr:hypothetical protein [Lachnospiraceae bacterium]